MTHYDVKFYSGNEERETIRGLTYAQMTVLTKVLDRLGIVYTLKAYESKERGQYNGYR